MRPLVSERPLWASEFILWCHLDGAIVNQPSHGAAAIIFNRVSSEMVKRGKHVDVVVFRDARCGTPLRVCPKYQGMSPPTQLGVAPDIFLMPQSVPTEDSPSPPAHDLDSVKLPSRILTAYGVKPGQFDEHLWQVTIELSRDEEGRLIRVTRVFHKGKLVQSGRSLR